MSRSIGTAVCEHLAATAATPGSHARWCDNPSRLAPAAAGHQGFVFASCPGGPTLPTVQHIAVRAGIDPLAVDIIRLAPETDPKTVAGAVDASRARLSLPLPSGVTMIDERPDISSRRSFLRLAPALRTPVPLPAPSCSAATGCRLCEATCPTGAVAVSSGSAHVDPDLCRACGLCIGVCPTGALVDPVATPAHIEAHVASLTGASFGGIAYVCRHRRPLALDDGWAAVPVSGLGAVTVGWLLAPLVLGAGAVAVVPCAVCGEEISTDRLAASQRLLETMGLDASRVGATGSIPPPLPTPPAPPPPTGAFGPAGLAPTLTALSTIGMPGTVASDPVLPLGRVVIGDRCTASLQCVSVCPTGALGIRLDRGDRAVELTASRCVGCGLCLSVCPEGGRGALDLLPAVLVPPGEEPVELRRHRTHRCERCGDIATAAMEERVAELLADSPSVAVLCERCRNTPTGDFAHSLWSSRMPVL